MVSITHFSHEHPLILKQLPPEEENPHVCYACQQSLIQEGDHDGDNVYGCETCKNIFLHKSCSQLPMEIVHKSHDHPLFLLSMLPASYMGVQCDLCNKYPGGLFYHCYLDDFDLDIKCALENKKSLLHFRKDLTLHHPSHKHHPLTLQPRPTSFLCDACNVEDKDLSYQCSSCHYLIHRRCAMLPSRQTNHDVHTHLLTLSFGLPPQYSKFYYYCAICENRVHTTQLLWLYYCELCRYFVHIGCMSIKKPQIEVDFKDLCIDDLPRLPMSDKSVELIHRSLVKSSNHSNIQQEISIFSHKHPLIYLNDEKILEDEIEDGEEVLCDGCIEPILTPPYYHCAECRYFLHLACAELPHELQHPSHKHPLILTSKSRFYESFKCNHCYRYSNGFFFCCTAEGCVVYLDVKCAALPELVEYKSHNHPLREQLLDFDRCIGCGSWCGWWWTHGKYACVPCKFYLHQRCLMLPETIKHRYDSNHPLTLRYPPHYYHPRPFDCAECETEINPNYWLYHCEECDLSFHLYCVNRSWEHYNFKFGQKLQTTCHPHPLKYVFEASVRTPCHGCRQQIHQFAFECETCNFHLCQPCVKKLEPLS